MKRNRVVRRPMLIKPLVFLVMIAAWIVLTPYSAYGTADGTPCSANSESRQLDFWLGDWRVTYPDAPGSSSSRVYTELDQCLLIESWSGGKGHRGENMFAYSANDKGWRGMFTDNQGRVHALEGQGCVGLGRVLRTKPRCKWKGSAKSNPDRSSQRGHSRTVVGEIGRQRRHLDDGIPWTIFAEESLTRDARGGSSAPRRRQLQSFSGTYARVSTGLQPAQDGRSPGLRVSVRLARITSSSSALSTGF